MPLIIQNVRTRNIEEGVDVSVIYKSTSFGFSPAAAKQYGIQGGSPAVPASPDGKRPAVKAVPASKFTTALFGDGEFGVNEEGKEVDLAGKVVVLVTEGTINFINPAGQKTAQSTYQLSSLLKGNPKEVIETLVKHFEIGEGQYKEVLKDKDGVAIPLPGVKKEPKDWTLEDVQTKTTTTVNDFTMTITDKIVEFTCADGYQLEGCFGLVLELNEQTNPKDDRVTKEIHTKKKAARAGSVTPPSNEAVQEGSSLMTADTEEEEEEIETEDENDDKSE